MRIRAGVAATLVVVALIVTGCSGSSDTSSPTTTLHGTTTSKSGTSTASAATPVNFTSGDFYAVPKTLPKGPHGTLIRYQEVSPAVIKGATTYRVMYTSTSMEGEPIAVTGTVLVPDAKAPTGGRPLLTIAHGTTGIADACAPSKDPGGELSLLREPIDRGWLVAETDYEGLGTPGRHPYLVGESEGRSTLDAIVAAGQLPNADPSDQLAIAGYSQGGHGALWANQMAPEVTPELHVVGTFAGAPATEMQVILRAAPGGFKALMVAGYAAAYPNLDPATFFTPAALAQLGSVDTGCTRDVFKAMASVPGDQLTRPDAFDGPWAAVADANDPGRVKTADPILIIHSQQDDTVPVTLSKFLLERMCKSGQVVERRVLPNGGGHVAAASVAYPQAIAWLVGRFAEKPTQPVNSCTS